MGDMAVQVENLGKKYVLGHQKQKNYVALRDVLATRANSLMQKVRHPSKAQHNPSPEDFWALKDVSFEIKQGDRVGIIGRNGAGKSTLLKILSRITEPTEGRITIRGRVASLLEVGTGFHPELTGRENIYLNGAILGMSRVEIQSKFDEIVAFAEVEQFLDTPVKRYSSGMYVRLAFAVAAHLEPEILVVDEVLAVGDVQFQKKCFGKMEEVGKEGRTVIFVSHDMTAIQNLCQSGICLSQGKVIGAGSIQDQVQIYLKSYKEANSFSAESSLSIGSGLELIKLDIQPNPVHSKDKIEILLSFYAERELCFRDLAILFYSALGKRIAVIDLRRSDVEHKIENSSIYTVRTVVNSLAFVEGDYSVGIWLRTNEMAPELLDLANITVLPVKDNDSTIVPYRSIHRGVSALDFSFSTSTENNSIDSLMEKK
jgi:lipopolysaccharide transport system ATP-binding protein